MRRPGRSPLFPYPTLFRSNLARAGGYSPGAGAAAAGHAGRAVAAVRTRRAGRLGECGRDAGAGRYVERQHAQHIGAGAGSLRRQRGGKREAILRQAVAAGSGGARARIQPGHRGADASHAAGPRPGPRGAEFPAAEFERLPARDGGTGKPGGFGPANPCAHSGLLISHHRGTVQLLRSARHADADGGGPDRAQQLPFRAGAGEGERGRPARRARSGGAGGGRRVSAGDGGRGARAIRPGADRYGAGAFPADTGRAVGLNPQIDVNRSQVQLQTERQRLMSLENDAAKQKINLARVVGLPVNDNYEITDDIPYSPAPDLTVEQALKQAFENRADLQSAEAQVRAAERVRSAAHWEHLPSLALSADYGAIGINPAQ